MLPPHRGRGATGAMGAGAPPGRAAHSQAWRGAQSLTGRLLARLLATQDGAGTESGAGDGVGGWEEKTWGQVIREPQAISWLLSL